MASPHDRLKAALSDRYSIEREIAAGLTSLVVWPFFDPIREDPRFADWTLDVGRWMLGIHSCH